MKHDTSIGRMVAGTGSRWVGECNCGWLSTPTLLLTEAQAFTRNHEEDNR